MPSWAISPTATPRTSPCPSGWSTRSPGRARRPSGAASGSCRSRCPESASTPRRKRAGSRREKEPPDHVDLTVTPDQVRIARLEIPEGVEVSAPVPVTVHRPFADYTSEYRVEGHTLVLERELKLKAKSVPRAEFDDLRALRKVLRGRRRPGFRLRRRAAARAAGGGDGGQPQPAAVGRPHRRREVRRGREALPQGDQLRPEHEYAWNNLGLARIHLRRYPEAEKALQRQLEINPNDEWAYSNLGWVAWDRGNFAPAPKR